MSAVFQQQNFKVQLGLSAIASIFKCHPQHLKCEEPSVKLLKDTALSSSRQDVSVLSHQKSKLSPESLLHGQAELVSRGVACTRFPLPLSTFFPLSSRPLALTGAFDREGNDFISFSLACGYPSVCKESYREHGAWANICETAAFDCLKRAFFGLGTCRPPQSGSRRLLPELQHSKTVAAQESARSSSACCPALRCKRKSKQEERSFASGDKPTSPCQKGRSGSKLSQSKGQHAPRCSRSSCALQYSWKLISLASFVP